MSDLDWQESDADASWPHERYEAVGQSHDYRVYHDPNGDCMKLPSPEVPPGGWWALIVRNISEGTPCIMTGSVHRSANLAKRDAQRWEDSA